MTGNRIGGRKPAEVRFYVDADLLEGLLPNVNGYYDQRLLQPSRQGDVELVR